MVTGMVSGIAILLHRGPHTMSSPRPPNSRFPKAFRPLADGSREGGAFPGGVRGSAQAHARRRYCAARAQSPSAFGRTPAPAARAAPAPPLGSPPARRPRSRRSPGPPAPGPRCAASPPAGRGTASGRGGSWPWNSSSYSFSPGRRPVKRISTSSSGLQAGEADHPPREVDDLHRLAHVEHEDPAGGKLGRLVGAVLGADDAGLQHQAPPLRAPS